MYNESNYRYVAIPKIHHFSRTYSIIQLVFGNFYIKKMNEDSPNCLPGIVNNNLTLQPPEINANIDWQLKNKMIIAPRVTHINTLCDFVLRVHSVIRLRIFGKRHETPSPRTTLPKFGFKRCECKCVSIAFSIVTTPRFECANCEDSVSAIYRKVGSDSD